MLRKSLILLTFATFAFADDIKELNDANFKTEVKKVKTTLVMFYAPWCHHSQNLMPKYSKAAELLADQPIALVKVDCEGSGKKTCKKFKITVSPTLKIFKNGKFSQDFDGADETDEIVEFVRANVGPVLESNDGIANLGVANKSEDIVNQLRR